MTRTLRFGPILALSLLTVMAGAAGSGAAFAQDAPEAPDAAFAAPDAAPGDEEDAPGAPVFGAGVDPNDPWIWGETAVLRGLDKVTAQTRDFEAAVGEDVGFFALTLSVKRCAKRPPEMAPETIVGMEIRDRQTDGRGNETDASLIYSGWMFGSSPGLNPLEHPVYDVWVLDCVAPAGAVEAAAAPAAEASPVDEADEPLDAPDAADFPGPGAEGPVD